MNTELFAEAITAIDDRFYAEAAQYQGRTKKRSPAKWGALAACLAVICVSTALLMPNNDGSLSGQIDMESITFNEVSRAETNLWHWPVSFTTEVWDKETTEKYYGDALKVPYVPEGLTAAETNSSHHVILDTKGNPVYDTVWLQFYHDYYEDGSPKLTEDVAAIKGFVVKISKEGIFDTDYILSKDETVTTDINGTEVTFSYCKNPYGPYDEETHEPSGYYNMYIAEFVKDGISYQIESDQLPKEEMVKITASIIG